LQPIVAVQQNHSRIVVRNVHALPEVKMAEKAHGYWAKRSKTCVFVSAAKQAFRPCRLFGAAA
jgi:hypothetical protein